MRALFEFRIALLTLAAFVMATSCNQQERAEPPAESQPAAAKFASRWDPQPDSTLFKATRGLGPIDQVRIHNQRFDGRTNRWVRDKSVTLQRNVETQFLSTWRALQAGPSMACFAPGYEVEFISGGRVLLRADVCFQCHNISIDPPDEIVGFDPDGGEGVALRLALDAALSSTQ